MLPDKLDAKTLTQVEWEHLRRSAGVRKYDILTDEKGLRKNNRLVNNQHTREIESDMTYTNWIGLHGVKNEDGTFGECAFANPDSLPEQSHSPTEAQLLMGTAISRLQGQQRLVYLLIFREGKSNVEAGKILGISTSSVAVYKRRAQEFVTAYCKGVLANERKD